MEGRNLEKLIIKDLSMEPSLPTPRQIMNQSAEYEVIEKAAQLLKKVEQHWKKSLFHNRLQFSPVPESLNSSESENYIEKLAAIKFKDASFKKQNFCGTGNLNDAARDGGMDQKVLTNYDTVNNYIDTVGMRRMNLNEIRKEENHSLKCSRCLGKERNQNKSMSVLPRQQYVLKQTVYSQRGRMRQMRGGTSMQVSPRSNDSLQTARTYTSANSPRNKSNLTTVRPRISSSNPDLRNVIHKETSRSQRHQNHPHFCEYDPSDYNLRMNSLNKSDTSNVNNVSVVNIKSSNQTDSSIPEVNPRKTLTAPDKMIIIQHLPQVDIRPELSKQSGPVISIEAQKAEIIKESKNNNIGVFNYIHSNKPKFNHQEFKPLSSYNRYRTIVDGPACTEEEYFAAQLELRSVAENFIFRLKKNDNPTSQILMETLLRLMDEVNEMVELNLSGSGCIPTDKNLPPRMEMVSDLLSDELKTWGAQQPSHYQSLNNIIQHLILDIHFSKNNSTSFNVLKQNSGASTSDNNNKILKNGSILKMREALGEPSGKQKHVSLRSNNNYHLERSEMTFRSPRSEELSLSDKLLQENALKVLRLEKAYKINHEARELIRKNEIKELEKKKEKLKELNDKNHHEASLGKENGYDSFEDSNKFQSGSSSGNDSHPVIAIISPSQKESIEEEDNEKVVSQEVSDDVEDKSIVEEIEEDKNSIPEDENYNSEIINEHHSEGHHVEKHSSEGEEEVIEVIDHSSPEITEKHKESGDEYDEDFEPDETEHQSQSATTSNFNEVTGKSSESHHLGTDEVLIKSSLECNDSSRSISRNLRADNVFIDKSTVSLPQFPLDTGKRKVKMSKKGKKNYGTSRVGLFPDKFHSEEIESNNIINKQNTIRSLDNVCDKKLILNDKENKENFVKVHVCDNEGEMILSYVGSKFDSKRQSMVSEPKNADEKHVDLPSETLRPPTSIDNYIETERKILENLTSNILKEFFDNKIQSLLSKFSKENIFDKSKPSSSQYDKIKQQSTQTSPEKLLLSDISEENNKLLTDRLIDKNEINEYQLKSPKVKLKVHKDIKRREIQTIKSLDINKKVENDDGVEEEGSGNNLRNDGDEENHSSSEVKLLIGMVSDLDSSDIDYCESSLKHLSNKELNRNNTNVRLHHFNSDEFLVYPRLNPQPSDIKMLQYSKEESKNSNVTSGDSMQSRDFESINKEQLISSQIKITELKSVGTEYDTNDFRSLQPLDTLQAIPKTIFSSSSTQTDKATRLKPYSIQTPSLVDLIEISCSQSSSGSESNKGKFQTLIKESLNLYKTDNLNNLSDQDKFEEISSKKPITEIETEEHLEKTVTSEEHSIAPNEIIPLIFFNEGNNIHRGTSECDPNDNISTTTDNTESSSTVDSSQNRVGGIHGSILRMVEASTARSVAWSSSTESTTDDEKFLIMNQPLSDDDALGDLEQLLDYLKNSKSSSIVRIRHCSRHKKT